jgi:hypothetical protein
MLTKIYAGCYRTNSTLSYAFGHIRKQRDGEFKGLWVAELRNRETGSMLRPAGAWKTLNEARQECQDLMWRDYRSTESLLSQALAQ